MSAFHLGLGIAAVLIAGGGALGVVGIVNPRRDIHAAEHPGGRLAAATAQASDQGP